MNAITTTENNALATSQPTQFTGPMGSAIAALQAGMSIEQMQGVMGLQTSWEANEARKAYVHDMAIFKLNPPVIFKDTEVAYAGTAYMHATLGGVTEKIVGALAQHGFSHAWEVVQKDDGQVFVSCRLTHRLGHSELTTLKSSPDTSGKKNNIQALASTVSYLSRYTLLLACGLATKDMGVDDGRHSEGEQYNADAMLEMWVDLVNDATSLEVLSSTKKSAGLAFKKRGDIDGWNTIKALVADRRAVLEASVAPTGVSA